MRQMFWRSFFMSSTYKLSSIPLNLKAPQPLVYLTCKHIVHYDCIDNSRKLCPICPSTEEIDADVDDDVNEIQSSSNSMNKKRVNTSADKVFGKKSNKRFKGNDFIVLKRLIWKLSSDTTWISEIKEKKGLHRESVREVEGAWTFFKKFPMLKSEVKTYVMN